MKIKTLQLLPFNSNAIFLPLKVLFDTSRSATLNPLTSPVTISKTIGRKLLWRGIRGFDPCTVDSVSSIPYESSSDFVLAGNQFNVVTTLSIPNV